MAVHLSFVLIIAGLTGIDSITTVSKVSVKSRASISIPCLYDSQYRNHVKFLCEGTLWLPCSTKVGTDTQGLSGKFSISDDKIKSIFTVTMKDLIDEDTGYYWCAVEIEDGSDVKKPFHLSVTRGTPSFYVDHQEVTGFKGEKITISCYYRNSGVAKWCRLGSSCVTWPSGLIHGTTVTISANVPNVFTVTMSGLKIESSGWYYCVKGDLQMPVHVTVTEKPTIPTHATTGFSTLPPTPDHISVTGHEPTTKVEKEQRSASVDLKSLIIPLALLIFIVTVVLFIWFTLKRHKKTRTESSATTAAEEEVTYSAVKPKRKTSSQNGEDMTYCNVGYMRKSSGQRSCAESDVDVMYSSVVILPKSNKL